MTSRYEIVTLQNQLARECDEAKEYIARIRSDAIAGRARYDGKVMAGLAESNTRIAFSIGRIEQMRRESETS